MEILFEVKMLPAEHGDCILITYGDERKPNRILIDGGTSKTYSAIKKEIEKIPLDQRNFQLLVVTHVDTDHILGVLELLEADELNVSFQDIWFNGYPHLDGSKFRIDLDKYGPRDGERLSSFLVKQEIPWNKAFNSKSIFTSPQEGIPQKILEGGLKVSIVSPSEDKLEELKPVWRKACRKAGLIPGEAIPPLPPIPPDVERYGPFNLDKLANSPFDDDESESNGSSIGLLIEYKDKRILLTGDAHADVLRDSIQKLKGQSQKLRLDAFKVPHHGSRANISKELLQDIDCKKYLISTNGHRFKHPHREAIARIIKFGGPDVEIFCNYKSSYNKSWDNAGRKQDHKYEIFFPARKESISLKLM